MSKDIEEQAERDLEAIASNIVHQIGDALYEALPQDIAHEHFVNARQATNDMAIDFAKLLIAKRDAKQKQKWEKEARPSLMELKQIIDEEVPSCGETDCAVCDRRHLNLANRLAHLPSKEQKEGDK